MNVQLILLWVLYCLLCQSIGAEPASHNQSVKLDSCHLHLILPYPEEIDFQPHVQYGRWNVAQYSSAEIYSFAHSVPAPLTSDYEPNAVSVTYGDRLHLAIAVVPEFLSTLEILSRLLDLQELRRSRRGDAPVMITSSAQRMVGPVPADEVGIELRDTITNNILYTVISSAVRGDDIVVVFLRCRTDPRSDTTWSGRFYRQLLAAIEMENFFDVDTVMVEHPLKWRVVLPQSWMSKTTMRISSRIFLPDESTPDSTWNTVVVQLPYVQIEFSIAKTSLGDTALLDYADHIAMRRGLMNMLPVQSIQSRIPLLRRFETLSPSRGKDVQYTYFVIPYRSWLGTIRLTAWAHDMHHLERFLPKIVACLHFPPSNGK